MKRGGGYMVFAVNNFDEKFATLDAKMSDLKEEYKKVNARIDAEVLVQSSSRRGQGDFSNRPAGGRRRSFVDREGLDISPPANRRKDGLTSLGGVFTPVRLGSGRSPTSAPTGGSTRAGAAPSRITRLTLRPDLSHNIKRRVSEVSSQAANVSSGTAEWKKSLILMSAEELQ